MLTTVLTATQANTSEQRRRVIPCIWLIYQVLWPVTNSGERTNTDLGFGPLFMPTVEMLASE